MFIEESILFSKVTYTNYLMHGKIVFLIFGFFFVFRYCINSCSMEFLPETEVDGSVKKEDAEEIHHPATLGGCSSDGTCRLPPKSPRTAVRDRIEIRANFLDTSSNSNGLR